MGSSAAAGGATPFFIASDPRQTTPGWVEVWCTPFPTRAAAEAALGAAGLEGACVVIEAPTMQAARAQVAALVADWSR